MGGEGCDDWVAGREDFNYLMRGVWGDAGEVEIWSKFE